MWLNNSLILTKGGLKDLDHKGRACKGHPIHITTPNRMHTFPLGVLLLILHGPHLLPILVHLNTIPNLPINHLCHMLPHNLIGIPHHKGGGPHSTNLQPYYLHLHLNHNSFSLLHLTNFRCLLSQIQTQTTSKDSKSIVERHPTLPMLSKFKKSTSGLEECSSSQSTSFSWETNPS